MVEVPPAVVDRAAAAPRVCGLRNRAMLEEKVNATVMPAAAKDRQALGIMLEHLPLLHLCFPFQGWDLFPSRPFSALCSVQCAVCSLNLQFLPRRLQRLLRRQRTSLNLRVFASFNRYVAPTSAINPNINSSICIVGSRRSNKIRLLLPLRERSTNVLWSVTTTVLRPCHHLWLSTITAAAAA